MFTVLLGWIEHFLHTKKENKRNFFDMKFKILLIYKRLVS